MDPDGSPFRSDTSSPPRVPGQGVGDDLSVDAQSPQAEFTGAALDEEPPQHVPGSFLEALPQFFVFPAILVVTLTAIYLLLRVVVGTDADSARELLDEFRVAGPHGRWQLMHSLANGLNREQLTLDEVSAAELALIYEAEAQRTGDAQEADIMRSTLLHIMAWKGDPSLTPFAVEALDSASEDLVMAALASLARMGDPTSVDAIAARLDSPVPGVRLLALGALGNFSESSKAREAVAGALISLDPMVARNAALISARQRNPAALPMLLRLLDPDSYAQDGSMDLGLSEFSEASRVEALGASAEAFLIQACQAAAELGDPSVVASLQKLREPDRPVKVRSAAINALDALGVESVPTENS